MISKLFSFLYKWGFRIGGALAIGLIAAKYLFPQHPEIASVTKTYTSWFLVIWIVSLFVRLDSFLDDRTLEITIVDDDDTVTHEDGDGFQWFLDISTAHITYNDSLILAAIAKKRNPDAEHNEPIVRQDDYSWWIHVPLDSDWREEIEEYMKHGFSDAFRNLMIHAHDGGAWWVRLDQDAEKITALPTYEW